ncbi:MAG: saccharopine dehydrogenase NADP-binding domain-containing protein [Armatimonadota bacterium]
MDTPRIGVLGGYGYTGSLLVRLLLEHTGARLVVAGRNPHRAKEAAGRWNQQFPGERVRGVYADASCAHSLWEAFEGVDLLVVAAPVVRYVETVARAALRVDCDYLDILLSTQKLRVLRALENSIVQAGRTFITEAGYTPGLPALLVRYAGCQLSRLEVVNVFSVVNPQGGFPLGGALYEFADELARLQCMAYRDGGWHRSTGLGPSEVRQADFGFGFGARLCVPMMLEEMRALPEMLPSLRETAFYLAGFNWFVDWVVMPLIVLGGRVAPRSTRKPLAHLLHWGTRMATNPPYGAVIRLEACGWNECERQRLAVQMYHPDPYVLTAMATVAGILQYLRGHARKPGLWLAGHLWDPQQALQDMQAMGAKYQQEMSSIQGTCPFCGG